MTPALLFVHALTPLHAGTGQGIGVIDLPIARERATNLPYLPGSSLKGALRAACEDAASVRRLFGPDTRNASEHAGALTVSDQSLLLFPVRSLIGTFALATCPWVLRRFTRDARSIGLKDVPDMPNAPKDQATLAQGSALLWNQKIVLEDLDLRAAVDPAVSKWAEWLGQHLYAGDSDQAAAVRAHLAVLPDDTFDYLVDQATEVVARIKLKDDTKTVQNGGLWYEESLPAESILSGLVMAEKVNQGGQVAEPAAVLDEARSLVQKIGTMQLGGKATVGRGLCRLVWKAGAR
jgi:CRISPR-associated protein Cmr4